MSKSSTSSSGIGFGGILAILFIGLKLTGFIAWSWLWVLAPLWIPLALVLGFAVLVGIVTMVAAAASGRAGA